MKKLHWQLCQFGLLLLFTTCVANIVYSQCSSAAITAKYWQYRENLKHFVAIDRSPNGCVNDGIGQSSTDPCNCGKSGYSLPGTSINMHPNGSNEQQDRNVDPEEGKWNFKNPSCFGPTGQAHNVLDMGSETPHQMGWYWVTLATEYQLLKQNGQDEEAQRTLEELFLGLQAYRRLDIQANCIVKQRYDELAALGENFLLCSPIYTDGSHHKHFDTFYDTDCNYTPQVDGFSGFFLREDATQALEPLLHDPSEGKWNIDAIKSDYSNSLVPPCEPMDWYNQFCYLAHRQDFMSQDGVIGLLLGLAMIKRYIPPSAIIYTCNGQTYSPLSIATSIATAITNRLDFAYGNRIYIPGADDCLKKPARISAGAGGDATATIFGIQKACSYIDEKVRVSSVFDRIAWAGLTIQTISATKSNAPLVSLGDNANFWLRLMAIGWDLGNVNDKTRDLFLHASDAKDQQILPMINDLLYPDLPEFMPSNDRQYLEDMLCAAPCGGPCEKRPDYADGDSNWPQFECPNNPEWNGQRWETHDTLSLSNRQFNGLDFMSLYNTYMLRFPQEQTSFFNPDRPQGNIGFNGNDIAGPWVLCPIQTGNYLLIHPRPASVQNLVWTTSTNLQVLSTQGLGADIRANTKLIPSFIETTFKENNQIQEYVNTTPQNSTVIDVCDLTYRKPIVTDVPDYSMTFEFDHCTGIYEFHAIGPDVATAHYLWVLKVHPNGGAFTIMTATGKDAINQFGQLPGTGGWIEVTLSVTADCGVKEFHTVQFYSCGTGRQILVAPNATMNGNQVLVGITNNYLIDAGGLDIRFIRTGTGSLQSTQRIYYNGQPVNITNFPTGNYTVQAVLDDSSVLNTTLIISEH